MLLTRDDIEQVEAFSTGGAPVLNAYLDLDLARQVRRSYWAGFEDLVKAAREPLEKRRRLDLERQAPRVRQW